MKSQSERLILEHTELAHNIAAKIWKTAPNALDFLELRSIGYLGLVSAANRWPAYCTENNFSPDAEQYFVAYASRRIRGSIYDALRVEDYATRSLRTQLKQLRDAGLDVGASIAEMIEATGLTETIIMRTLAFFEKQPVSLDDTWGTDLPKFDLASSEDIESTVVTKELLKVTADTIRQLDKQSQLLLALHYYRGIELQEIHLLLNVSESTCSHIHISAIMRIHEALVRAALPFTGISS